MNILIAITPLIISVLPVLLMLFVYQLQRKIDAPWLILSAVIPVILFGFITPFWAISVSVKGFAQSGVKSATGAAVFWPIACFFTLAATIWGIVCYMRSFRKSSIK